MLYLDFIWDLFHDKIVLDQEINIDKLGWKNGDYFKLVNINGRAQLVKVDVLEAFIKGHKVHEEQN
jgi:hypothetical protein